MSKDVWENKQIPELDYQKLAERSTLDPEEITCVMFHTSCSREQAMEALKKYKNMVDAFLELSEKEQAD